jgi:endo-1,4-beta-xylanase
MKLTLSGAVIALLTFAGVSHAQTAPLVTEDFAAGQGAWFARGEAKVEVVDGALLTTARTANWQGPAVDMVPHMKPGATYEIALKVKLAAGIGKAPVTMTMQRTPVGGDQAWDTIVWQVEANDADWTEVKGSYTYAAAATELQLYVESPDAAVNFLIDDVVVIETVPAPAEPVENGIEDIIALKDVFKDDFTMGVAIDSRETIGAPKDLLLKHFGQITPENHMKPESIQPTEGRFTFGQADKLLEFAEANNLRVYGHVLVWHSQTPGWFFLGKDNKPLTNSPEDRQIALDRMKAHIDAVAEHMKGRVWAFDVVNEVIDESQADGLRRSRWYDIVGPDYIEHAFTYARAAFGPDVKLFINDYSTEFPAKREAYYALVKSLRDKGVPIDGVGHQFHTALSRSPTLMDATLTKFSDLGMIQAVTELDVSISASDNESLPETPPERLVTQGYYLKELGEVFRKHADQIEAVTVWGLTDNRSWLKFWPSARPHEAPLLFDDKLMAKPAFWGLVDPTKLPHLPRRADVFRADMAENPEGEWDWLPGIALAMNDKGRVVTTLALRWDYENLHARLRVGDGTVDDGDKVEFFVGDETLEFSRAEGKSDGDGYTLDVALPAEGSTDIPFDLRITDVSGTQVSWSDQAHDQENAKDRRGTLTLLDALARTDVPKATEAPVIDGVAEPAWDSAVTLETTVPVEGNGSGAKAVISLIWDRKALYVLAKVTDPSLDKANSNAWEQDSIEIFLAPGNERLGPYQPLDGQYRINYENHVSVAGDLDKIGTFLTSAAKLTDTGYIVEASIALPDLSRTDVLGADFQVNDATAGKRTGVTTWNDPTGQSYQNTTRWGAIRLVE